MYSKFFIFFQGIIFDTNLTWVIQSFWRNILDSNFFRNKVKIQFNFFYFSLSLSLLENLSMHLIIFLAKLSQDIKLFFSKSKIWKRTNFSCISWYIRRRGIRERYNKRYITRGIYYIYVSPVFPMKTLSYKL